MVVLRHLSDPGVFEGPERYRERPLPLQGLGVPLQYFVDVFLNPSCDLCLCAVASGVSKEVPGNVSTGGAGLVTCLFGGCTICAIL